MTHWVSKSIVCGLVLLAGCQGTGGKAARDAALPEKGGRVEVDLSDNGWRLWLDKDAAWENDELFLPGTALSKIPTNPPTGGWAVLSAKQGMSVAVPGTVEQYLQKGEGPDGDIKGVSWWYRTLRIPAGQRTILRFDAVRQRAEVYLDGQLVGYDLVGNTPFEADLTPVLSASKSRGDVEHVLAVRVTDFGGNFDWRDSRKMAWGKYTIPASHGFGGVSGRVKLVACDAAYVDDLYVQNTPELRTVNAIATLRNTTAEKVRRDALVEVFDRSDAPKKSKPVFSQRLANIELPPGESTTKLQINLPDAKVWSPDAPSLYTCRVSLEADGTSIDAETRAFGFRWFSPENIGSDAIFKLNGERIVLRTAISWGFWPITGLFPSPELAEREIRTAKEFGQNMLNFHRTLGNPISLEKADELGLLIYEEPGGYKTGDGNEFAHALATEKWLRMVKRDRSHPSVVIFNMINEGSGAAGPNLDAHAVDMRAAHAIDPSRSMTHTSGWAKAKDIDDGSKMHMRPYDDVVHMNGWYDFHHAGGPETWQQKLYKNPKEFYGLIDNQKEIVYSGEEGAISSPPRLEKIKAEIERIGQPGWDSAVYLDWDKRVDAFLDRKNLRGSFPTVDALTVAMGNISLYHQGRKIEQMRISNLADGYAVNGWEAEVIDNHSGIVDCYRFPKGDPSLIARYNQPLYVSVKSRADVVESPGNAVVDFFAVNEKNLKGTFTLEITAIDPSGKSMFTKQVPVTLDGGDHYGQLLTEAVNVSIGDVAGLCEINAKLLDASSQTKATGRTQVLAVRSKAEAITGSGAVWEADKRVSTYLNRAAQTATPAYSDKLGKLDWAVVTRPPDEGAATDIPADRLTSVTGDRAGVDVTFFAAAEFTKQLQRRVDPAVDLAVDDGAAPDPAVPLIEKYGVRWEGRLIPQVSGPHTLVVQTTGGVKLTVDGKVLLDVLDARGGVNKTKLTLEKGKAVTFTLDFYHTKGAALCKMKWALPEVDTPSPTRLLDRVRNDGTTLLLLDEAETWMPLIAKTVPGVTYNGSFKIGTAWLGGSHFVRKHGFFADLPVDGAMDWPYQAVVRNGRNRSGLLIEGEELIAGAYHCYPMQIGTAVGVIRYGKGRIVFSTLDLCDNLASTDEPAIVARKVFGNILGDAIKR